MYICRCILVLDGSCRIEMFRNFIMFTIRSIYYTSKPTNLTTLFACNMARILHTLVFFCFFLEIFPRFQLSLNAKIFSLVLHVESCSIANITNAQQPQKNNKKICKNYNSLSINYSKNISNNNYKNKLLILADRQIIILSIRTCKTLIKQN